MPVTHHFNGQKQIASHFGGTRNGMVVHWPDGIKAKGEVRSQFTHATDIAPTVMEAAGLPFPRSVMERSKHLSAVCPLCFRLMMRKQPTGIHSIF
jgi:arylsulfatase A-like enzyme